VRSAKKGYVNVGDKIEVSNILQVSIDDNGIIVIKVK
jgi:hypothetical protein